MKRIELIGLVCVALAVTVAGTDLTTVYVDTHQVADTVASATDYDSLYSSWHDIRDADRIYVYNRVGPPESHVTLNLTDDSFFFEIQLSPDQSYLYTIELDTLLGVDSAFCGVDLLESDSLAYGNWARMLWIHGDVIDADSPDSVNLIRAVRLESWLIEK